MKINSQRENLQGMTASKKVIDSLLQELFFLFEFEEGDMKGDMEGDMEVDIVGVMEEDMDTNMMGNFEGDIKGGHG